MTMMRDIPRMKTIYAAHSKHFFFFRMHISQFILNQNCVPLNPFMLFEYFLLDAVDRDTVRNANNNLVINADETWIFGPISDGVLDEVKLAKQHNKPLRYFAINRSREIIEIDKKDALFEEDLSQFADQL